ncbi:class I SAM-dependent methyltransferase [Patescibacteria group bacterium]|nr:class I SAM-dependent methyltransferase [Patescibacteria group bacterium]MBU0776664.1 class I SAM-dependent methyltransferase [Patescibacteria group bacterium]MBU0846016.1 class I SAM-dependent methyltransferase [Patescibacteria group bacterium]MBU0922484.1 class I SAM-dependent methyltransferase [Patescibacteria group bacterium]MBU1066783.1 class I SAM-dependent methyltransferase [Patescibacteria group bacterium]
MDFKKFYEKYHEGRLLPKRIIGKKDFTYRHIVLVLDKYCTNKDILDVGSGVGTLDLYLASKGRNVTGIEISERAVDIANKSLEAFDLKGKVKFILGNFLKLEPKGKYAFVICSEVLEHLKDDKIAVKMIHRLAKRGGLAMITVPSKNAPLIKFGAIEAFDKRSGHLRRYTLESLSALLEKHNFKVVYSKKTEGILRNSLYVFKFLHPIIRVANRFSLVSDMITFLDNITLALFGESQIIVVVKK